MVELVNGKRLIFKNGLQKKLLQYFCHIKNISQKEAATFFGIVPRSFTDWINEKTKLPLSAYNKVPPHIRSAYLPEKTIDKFWYTKIGAKIGARVLLEKYGRIPVDEDYRKKKWKEWWNENGKYQINKVVGIEKNCVLPKPSKNLAEFFGIMIGDGGMTKYQCTITLNAVTDAEYSKYVQKIIYTLFKINPKISFRKNTKALEIVISRKKLNTFLWELGLKKGNKLLQGLDIPKWIMENAEYQKACVRGLFDTDGCLFYEVHNINGKRYIYPRLNLVTGSKSLSASVMNILDSLGLIPKLRNNGRNFAIQVENKEKICEYFKIIGTSNPKHLSRWHSTLT